LLGELVKETAMLRPRVVLLAPLVLLALLAALPAQESRPHKYALLVGVRQYPRGVLGDLHFTENDVEKLADWLQHKGGYDVVVVMTQSRAARDVFLLPTRANVEKNLEEVLKLVRPQRGDHVLVAFSGHGVEYPDAKNRQEKIAYFCPADVEKKDRQLTNLVSLAGVFGQLKASDADVKLLVVDACREVRGDKGDADEFAPPRPPKGIAAFYSCGPSQKSFEYDPDEVKAGKQPAHGLFMYRFLEGLNGARSSNGMVTLESVAAHVKDTVPVDAKRVISVRANQDPEVETKTIGKPVVLAKLAQKEKPPLLTGSPDARRVKELQRLWAEYLGVPVEEKVDLGGGVKMELVLIPPGKCWMGSPATEADRAKDEEQHEVTLTKAFYLGKHEVTQEQWQQVMGSNPSYFASTGDGKDTVQGLATGRFPVEQVSWEDAQQFIDKLSGKNRLYRLPSEAEWEYCCRGGACEKASRPFHFDDPRSSLSSDLANFNGEYPYGGAAKGKLFFRTAAVGTYAPNRFGVYDMHGNVWEWCADWYWEGYYQESPQEDPPGPSQGPGRVNRGGSWRNNGSLCRAADRDGFAPAHRYFNLGLRLALSPTSR
jgi:formylglycine-generating enzyme required for sulfatase activity